MIAKSNKKPKEAYKNIWVCKSMGRWEDWRADTDDVVCHIMITPAEECTVEEFGARARGWEWVRLSKEEAQEAARFKALRNTRPDRFDE